MPPSTPTSTLNLLLPGFQMMGFAQQMNALVRALNVAAVRAHLPVLQEKLQADTVGLGLGVDPQGADLVATWNALCAGLDGHPAITIKDYGVTCTVERVEDFSVQWRQLCVGLDREPGLSGTYTQYLGAACVPLHYQ